MLKGCISGENMQSIEQNRPYFILKISPQKLNVFFLDNIKKICSSQELITVICSKK